MADAEAWNLHAIFQAHHIPPDEVYAKPRSVRNFMYASMQVEAELVEAERNKRQTQKGGGRHSI